MGLCGGVHQYAAKCRRIAPFDDPAATAKKNRFRTEPRPGRQPTGSEVRGHSPPYSAPASGEKGRSLQEISGFFDIDGVTLEYQLHIPAPKNNLTLVLLHEGLGCVALWKDFPFQLARRTQCRVLAYSRAGYGGSAPCPLPRPLSFMHDEGLQILPLVLAAAEIDQYVLLGHSDGASIALIHAGEAAGSGLRGLVLMAPHVFVEELPLASIGAAATAFQETDLRQRLARYHGDNVDCAFWGWNRAWLDPDFRSWNLESYLPAIQVPTLLLQGKDDEYGTVRQLKKIATPLGPLADTVLIPACGHAPFRDQPAAVLDRITGFLATHA